MSALAVLSATARFRKAFALFLIAELCLVLMAAMHAPNLEGRGSGLQNRAVKLGPSNLAFFARVSCFALALADLLHDKRFVA